ncbi:uncharacterized protein, partial [Diabrotica undecimpunctata]|uniref:uncharacterized protein n=1 Tax=Diabrotica undecimpunctata TaxID=50387 RepID=UPI003B63DA67
PNMSSTEDKPRLGGGLPLGGTADPLSDPDKGFYENLPFHGMQNPPSKPISIIAPFHQRNIARKFVPSTSTKSLISSTQTLASTGPFQFSESAPHTRAISESFNGFQNHPPSRLHFTSSQQIFSITGSMNNSLFGSINSQPSLNNNNNTRYLPSIFSYLPHNFSQRTGAFTFSGVPNQNSGTINRVQSLHSADFSMQGLRKITRLNSVSSADAVLARSDDIRRTASGINKSTEEPVRKSEKINLRRRVSSGSNRKLATIVEKRFGSLDIRKHKCYSPTFYSMRCKKHAKKRPIIVTLPKKCFSELALSNKPEKQTENLSDSIQITEESPNARLSQSLPIPAPRCRKKHEIVYANISKSLNSTLNSEQNTSGSSCENEEQETSITEVEVHAETTKPKPGDSMIQSSRSKSISTSTILDHKPKLIAVSPKTNNFSPNFIKPNIVSPKGALSLQIQAKIKTSAEVDKADVKVDGKKSEQVSSVPKMPILNAAHSWNPNVSNKNHQNAFYTLSTPNFKQLNTMAPPQYSATIPHQKHTKLIPKALFQEQVQKSKSFSSKSKQKKNHFQIPLQKCHSFKFQTAESYFQPIKNIHEENLMRNGYVSDFPESTAHRSRHHKREKHKQKTKGPLVLRRPSDYQENVHFQENMQNSVQLQYPQPLLGRQMPLTTNKPNGVVYADLDMPANKRSSHDSTTSSKSKSSQNSKQKTEYATLKFNEIGQEIDV